MLEGVVQTPVGGRGVEATVLAIRGYVYVYLTVVLLKWSPHCGATARKAITVWGNRSRRSRFQDQEARTNAGVGANAVANLIGVGAHGFADGSDHVMKEIFMARKRWRRA